MSNPQIKTDHEKADIILITGFLGAGKTTLLKKILSWEKDLSDTVVIVNEFGEVGIDGALLKDSGSDVVELASGCICCSLKVNLNVTLKNIHAQFHPRQIIIESTGVADPGGVLEVLEHKEIQDHMALHRVITVLDCELWEAREYFGPIFFNQLHKADIILLNKIDVLDEGRIPEMLKEIHETIPHCRVVPTIHCNVGSEIFEGETKRAGIEFAQPMIAEHNCLQTENPVEIIFSEYKTESPYVTFSFEDSRFFDENCFKRFTDHLPWELFRMKGIVRFHDRTALVNHVGGKSRWTDWQDSGKSRIAFIGWNVNADETLRKLEACIKNSDSHCTD
jgi:G3E family GTPase